MVTKTIAIITMRVVEYRVDPVERRRVVALACHLIPLRDRDRVPEVV